MYQALLTRKYLTSKIMPLLAMVAVLLSVATVLITWSVMGGFLRMLLDSGRVLVGDVTITWPATGFAYYDELVDDLEKDDLFVAATPVIEYFAQIQLPDGRPTEVYVKGVDPEGFDRVTGYMAHVWWRPMTEPTSHDEHGEDWRLDPTRQGPLAQFLANAKSMTRSDDAAPARPAAILGIEVTNFNQRESAGIYTPFNPVRTLPDGTTEVLPIFMPSNGEIILTVLPPAKGGGIVAEPVTRSIPVANEFQSGIYEADKNSVLVPFGWLQSLLNLGEARRVTRPGMFDNVIDPATGEPIPAPVSGETISPARATSVIARARDGANPDEIRKRASEIYAAFAKRHAGEVPSASAIDVATWEDLNRTLVAAVKKETGLVLFIFGIICFTTVFLVLAIFWAMINEKTRDIGILRALGASVNGVAGMWLSYGFALGLVGSVLGVVAATLIVHNINAIHTWLGKTFGLVIWDPRVYYFVEIPSKVVPVNALVILLAGVATCLLGAAIPAFRSARMDPVKSLRFE
ncbi:MAG: FtsX-like permease family protein [Phycisphaerales bacterium]